MNTICDTTNLESLIRSWVLAMRAQSLRERTIEERVRTVRAVHNDMNASPLLIGSRDIATWLARRPSAITKWSYYTNLNAFFRWLTLHDYRKDNPLSVLPKPKRPKYQPRPVAPEAIVRVLEKPRLYPSTRAYILLATFAGLRVHEIAKIHGNDYNSSNHSLIVEGKGGNQKLIPLHSDLRNMCLSMPQASWWFSSPTGGHVTGKAVSSAIKNAFKAVGVDMKPHQLRHSFATQLFHNGADIRVVQELMRHENIQTTALYTQVSETQKRTALESLSINAP
ncbi:MAG: tyrosine-type recombinase/integrase [Actinomycetaceae bacterium]|nr:tyrosine-type recombinase/integrase [Actinomycetaceae bacterium]